jgi:hypothetical protein
MSFLNSIKSSCSLYSSFVSSSSSKLDVEQSSSSAEEVSILPKPDSLIFPDWQILLLLFENLITVLDSDKKV